MQRIELKTQRGEPVSLYALPNATTVHVATMEGEILVTASELVALLRERQRAIAVIQKFNGEREDAA
jgi:hypothetical protein